MAPPIGQQDLYNEQISQEQKSQGWGSKSTRQYKSYRVAVDSMNKDLSPESYVSTGSESNWKSERHVQGDKSLDGIEVSMNLNDNGKEKMKIMHVAGTRNNHQDLPLTAQTQPMLQVSCIKMATNYHPACDYATLHRIPIVSRKSTQVQELSQKQKLRLLENYVVSDEETATKDELHRNLIEMRNLENERDNISRKINFDVRLATNRCSIPECEAESDINKLLDQTNTEHHLDWDFKLYLQRRRGFCFHASFDDPDCRETFSEVCGGNRNTKIVHHVLQECSQEPFHVDKIAASAATITHVALTRGSVGTSFFVSKDDGRNYYDDGLPRRLIDRLKRERIKSSGKGAIKYLVCGPKESYYVQLVSGQTLWSISIEDEEFRNVMDTFDVQRVAFGSFNNGSSWIVVGQDGKVAWRNLPCRLNALLSKRTSAMAAPCEISLGEYGSYFIKFLDGDIDYSLPAHIAASCDEILKHGAEITSIALHPELSDAFVIRHTQLP